MNRILILMSNTGGGHRASAEALKAGFAERYGDRYTVAIIDLLIDYLPWPLNRLPPLYPWIANRTPWLWGILFDSGNFPQAVRAIVNGLARYAAPQVSQVFAQFSPDLIVSVHPLVHELTLKGLARLGRKTPLATVITDLASVHPLWFHPAVQLCFVASEEAYQYGLQLHMTPAQLRLTGLPIRPAFAQRPKPRAILRHELGLHPDLPAALLMGGGDGIGPVGAIAEAVAHRLGGDGKAAGQVVVICGRNQRLQEQLAERQWPVPLLAQGFVHNMPEWMAACDCIITKAGPGTIAEALACGLPIMLSGFIPGQEEGNVPFVVNNGVGAFSKDPQVIAATVARWFGPDAAERQQLAERARALSHPQATFAIVETLAGLL
ncbi:MAG TPA: glycosyltransferase [Caldilineaceae bacterium]|nr:glycosyltransferase [Caldilineaceae bacterium]